MSTNSKLLSGKAALVTGGSRKALMAISRYAQGEEIAGLVAYLAGPEASFVTGASLTIDGGFAA
jgi:3-oxoacyl-[acyl-carrier protein] reductase